MKVLLVTSQVHFVPDNYDLVVNGLAKSPHIAGLLVVNNLKLKMIRLAAGLYLIGAGRIARQIFKNIFSQSLDNRKRIYAELGKPVWSSDCVNSSEVLSLIREQQFDLVLNARTRSIFGPELLKLPPLGCINIHHGLLPEQRGVLCDLWALSENEPAGFSIHQMTEEVDAGGIISKVQCSDGAERDFLEYLKRNASLELSELNKVLDRIAIDGVVKVLPYVASAKQPYRRNPKYADIKHMKARGLLI